MSITLNGTPTRIDTTSPGTTVTITKPTGMLSTDILVALFGSNYNHTSVGTYTAPTGWTPIFTHTASNSASASVDLAGFWALGNVSNLGFTKSGNVIDLGVIVSAWSGVDNTTPIDTTSPTPAVTTGSATVNAPSITPTTTGAVELIAYADWLDGNASATGYTALENGSGGGAASNASAYLLYNLTSLTSGVATGTVTVTDSSGSSGQVLIAGSFLLRPAGGGGGSVQQQLTLLGVGSRTLRTPRPEVYRSRRARRHAAITQPFGVDRLISIPNTIRGKSLINV